MKMTILVGSTRKPIITHDMDEKYTKGSKKDSLIQIQRDFQLGTSFQYEMDGLYVSF
jgi:hypothetical protein